MGARSTRIKEPVLLNNWSVSNAESLLQTDGSSCGLFVIMVSFARLLKI